LAPLPTLQKLRELGAFAFASEDPSMTSTPEHAYLCTTVLPGHLHKSAMMHRSHSGLRARQV
jgi:hypothetical protein